MWFNNALIYRFQMDNSIQFADIEQEALKPCPPHARFTYGWTSPFPSSGNLVHETSDCALICLGKEERILPRAVINRILAERVHVIETEQGRSVKRAERNQLAEELEFELLPKSFCVQKKLFAFLDKIEKYVVINTSSANQATQLMALLRKSIPGISLEPLATPANLSMQFAQWINDPSTMPPTFELASDCVLFAINNENKRINCKGYELPAEEILTLLSQGLAAAELSLIWNERIQFTLTQDLTFKRIKALDYLIDDFHTTAELEDELQQRDAALTLLCGEFRGLVQNLLKGLDSDMHEKKNEKLLNEVCA